MAERNVKFAVALARKGLNQFKAAMEAGISPGELSIISRGYKNPTPAQRQKLMRLFTAKQIEKIFGQVQPRRRTTKNEMQA